MKRIQTIILGLVLFVSVSACAHTNTNAWAVGKSDRYVEAIENNDTKLIRKTREYRVAMKSHRTAYPRCEITNISSNFWGRAHDVHHYKPVEHNIVLACETNNMVTMIRDLHFWLGHLGNWKDENANLRETKVAVWKAIINTAESKLGNNKMLKRLEEEVKRLEANE